jgi:hypothetical protein
MFGVIALRHALCSMRASLLAGVKNTKTCCPSSLIALRYVVRLLSAMANVLFVALSRQTNEKFSALSASLR